MSYCVNCGVKLAPSERKCPLCACPVNNPLNPYDPRVEKPYPARTSEQNLDVRRGTALSLVAALLIVPALICILIDLMVNSAVTWSVYPLGALGMLLCTATAIILGGKNSTSLGILVGDTSLCLYLWLVQTVSGGGIWFQAVVFPVLLLAGVMTLAMWSSIRQHVLRGLAVPSVFLVLVAVIALSTDLLITVTLTDMLRVTWSVYVLIPCGVIALMLMVIHRSAALRSQLKRTLHL